MSFIKVKSLQIALDDTEYSICTMVEQPPSRVMDILKKQADKKGEPLKMWVVGETYLNVAMVESFAHYCGGCVDVACGNNSYLVLLDVEEFAELVK